jgi:superfamily I DNA/RNA helicase
LHVFLFKTGIAAIIIDDTHNLVVAGAGSGKTEVLITRVAYLKERESDGIIAKRILILAFQNKAAREISERLNKRVSSSNCMVNFSAMKLTKKFIAPL